MTPFVWRARMVTLEDGVLMFSRKGDWNDWDFFPAEFSNEQAIAMNVGARIDRASILDSQRLLIEAADGTYILHSDAITDVHRVEKAPQTIQGDAA